VPAIWNPEFVSLVKQKCVALALDGRVVNGHKDSETEFLLTKKVISDAARSAAGGMSVVTASGKLLAAGTRPYPGKGGMDGYLKAALKAFADLPPSERLPGAVQVPERGPLDPKRLVSVAPPPGALIVRVYNRQLNRDTKGELRYTMPADYVPALHDPKLGFCPGPTTYPDLFRQPGNDMMWITKSEQQAMMPAKPRAGQLVQVPETLCLRFYRFHLDPCRGFSEGQNFGGAPASAGKLVLTVEEASSSEVRLRLDGAVRLEDSRDYLKGYQSLNTIHHSQFTVGSAFGHGFSYKPRLLGYLAYDPAKKIFTRFDVVALGDVYGRPSSENIMAERVGRENPMGVAFDLVTDPKPADYLHPKGLLNGGGAYDLPRYLCLQKN
jgi:hypothetical protein